MLAFLGVTAFIAGCGSEPPDLEAREEAPETGETAEQATGPGTTQRDPSIEAESSVETTAEESLERLRCSEEERTHAGRGEIRIGDFEPPEEVPEYEIIEEKPTERYGAKATRLLVDTRVRSEEDFTLITRDIKSRYGQLDAVGIEFTDAMDTLSYNGGATIFNTPCGSDYIGYIWAPPNNEGYQVIAPKE